MGQLPRTAIIFCLVHFQDEVEKSVSVITSDRVQTDFSDECYQRVVSFTCDGGKVVTGGSDGVIRVWEVSIMDEGTYIYILP